MPKRRPDRDLLARLDGAASDAVTAPPTASDERLAALMFIGRVINSILDVDQILDILMDQLVALLSAERGFIMLVDPNTGRLSFRAARNVEKATLETPELQVSRSIVDAVFRDRKPVLSFNAADDPRYRESPSIHAFGLRAVLCLPMCLKGRVIGVIYLDNRLKRGAFREADLAFATAFADQAAMAIEHANLDAEKRRIRDLFEGYMSSELLADILRRDDVRLEGQRCVATVLFCDIRGFTSLCERLEPSTLVARLNEFYREMGEIVFRHGGLVFTYMGDAIMAVFGAPTGRDDDALRAVKAALDMCRRIDQLAASWTAACEPVFEIGIGLSTGEVIAGDVGFSKKREYTVIGDAVNVAARMEKLNKTFGSRVVLSDSTQAAVGHGLPLERLGTVEVRGKTTQMDVWSIPGLGARLRG